MQSFYGTTLIGILIVFGIGFSINVGINPLWKYLIGIVIGVTITLIWQSLYVAD